MTRPAADPDIVPDTKDWTWTLERPCPDCGFEAGAVIAPQVSEEVLGLTAPWSRVLERPDATQRPAPGTWSALEYACHVRDVCRIFKGRARLMLEQDGPEFEDWDQDATAVAERYHDQVPAVVGEELRSAALAASAAFADVSADQWARGGTRSNGSQFTVLTLGQYFLHDLAHHLVDVDATRDVHS